MIVGLSGKFCSGKSRAAQHLVERFGFREVAFANKLKDVCGDLFNMQGKERTLLQEVGMKMREVDPLVWVRYPLRDAKPTDNIVVSDVRYRNEADYIRLQGGLLIRLECPTGELLRRYRFLYGVTPTADQVYHVSETDLDDYDRFGKFDYHVNSTTTMCDELTGIMEGLKCPRT